MTGPVTRERLVWGFVVLHLAVVVLRMATLSGEWTDAANGWILGDWLLSYEAGFARRGLPGALILALCDATSWSPLVFVRAIQLALYAATPALVLHLVRGRRLELWFVLLVVSPATFLFPVLNVQGAGRKEILFFALLASWCLVLRRDRVLGSGGRAVFGAAVAALMLCHEGLLFFVPFFTAAYLIAQRCNDRPIRPLDALFLPLTALAVAALVGLFGHSDGAAYQVLCAGLVARGIDPSICHGVLGWPTGLAENLRISLQAMRSAELYPLAGGLALLPLLVLVAARAPADHPRVRYLLRVVGAAVALTAPLYFLGADFGRWIHATAMSVLLVTISALPPRGPEPCDPAPRWSGLGAVAITLAYMSTWMIQHHGGPGVGGNGVMWRLLRALFAGG